MTEHQKGGNMFSTSIVVESDPISEGFRNINIHVPTKHPLIQTQVHVFNYQCTPT
jgi:hypothetical protein